ncbi:MAG: hypothetical protein IH611_01585 [Deltaproteobacteria bacterium]|nr:hypothetical protein [Deltaproteobacteria bacterium]
MTKQNRMTTLSDLAIGNPKEAFNLVAVPLSGNPSAALEYILVDEVLTGVQY